MKILILDTETTGLLGPAIIPLERQPHIIELYMLMIDEHGEQQDTFHSLFNPMRKLPDIIPKITGITDKMLENEPHWFNHAGKILTMIEGADRIVAHNLMFDKGMIDNEMARCSLKVKWPELYCTVEQSMHLKGHRLKLEQLHELLTGKGFEGAHRAKSDVLALRTVYLELQKCQPASEQPTPSALPLATSQPLTEKYTPLPEDLPPSPTAPAPSDSTDGIS